jgi:hypothetical protein
VGHLYIVREDEGVDISFKLLKIDSQLLETSLQTPSPNFLEAIFENLLLYISFYKNSMDPNRDLICYPDLFCTCQFCKEKK